MNLIVGLGNPGAKYKSTRHNVGFMLLDSFAQEFGLSIQSKAFDGRFGQGTLWGQPVLLLKPETFMNLSGRSVRACLAYYKLAVEDLIVIHDDVDLEPGHVRMRTGGGAGGHNGIRSLIDELGSQEFYRVKIGIGKPVFEDQENRPKSLLDMVQGTAFTHNKEAKHAAVASWVLSPFSQREVEILKTDSYPQLLERVQQIFKHKDKKGS
ncbi:MAG: aminoacyl-tRNA hydrolase [Oligoflexales bacterium]|nr:aminoacyl-tRNA hydrolase [Oligoflexales bacterium]